MKRARFLLVALTWLSARAVADETPRWAGVDETVVERAAAAAGQQPWRTLLDDSGDLPLFFFLCAGLVGGFVLGYNYRALFAKRQPTRSLGKGKP